MRRSTESAELLAGRYRLGEELGSGAHGTVYVAEDLGRGGKRIALKVTQSSHEGLAFFSPAAQTLHWFRHPGWAEVYDAGVVPPRLHSRPVVGSKARSSWFQAMRLVEGQSLENLDGPQELEFVYRFLDSGARVLQAMHEQGLIHYDVTPSNFILEASKKGPRFVLTDGGLAHRGPVVGTGRGTALFMAPELTEEGAHDHRVDLYSLGLIAFRLTTGRDAFPPHADPFKVLGQRRREKAPRAISLRPDTPAALDELLASLLDRDPDERPADGRAILLRLAELVAEGVPEVRRSEAFARAEGGLLVDRAQLLSRFADSCRVLSRQVPGDDDRPQSAPEIPPDAVLILEGAPGCGGTRTMREMILQARIHETPVLLLAGRDGPPDPNAPLEALRRSFDSLRGKSMGLARRGNRLSKRGRAERAHSEERAIEQFLAEAVAAAAETPFILAVEDFGELPELARKAVSVLARELISRHEHGNTVAPPPILLVVDMGATPTAGLLIADAKDSQRPLCHQSPLTVAEIEDVATTRFPGLRLTSEEATSLHGACEGAPATLVAFMAEAIRQDDLHSTNGAWTWNLSQLASYPIRRRLPPIHENALVEADEDLMALLAYLALVDRDLDRSIAEVLWSSRTTARFAQSPLINTLHHDGRDVVALASHAIRSAVLEGLAADARAERTRELLKALDASPSESHALDRSRLLIDMGDPQGALDALTKHTADLSAQERTRIQEDLRRICESSSDVLKRVANRRSVTALLERGVDAAASAELVAKEIPEDGSELGVVIRLVEVLEETGSPAVQALLDKHAREDMLPTAELAKLQLRGVRAELNRRELARATSRFGAAIRTVRKLSTEERNRGDLGTLYHSTKGMLRIFGGQRDKAIRHLKRSLRIAWGTRGTRGAPGARGARDIPTLSKLHNNLGIVYQEADDPSASRHHFTRALRLKRALGDVRGTLAATFNLARGARLQGELLLATSLSYDCVGRAQRHGLTPTLVKTLRELSRVLDQQNRPDLALGTLERAWRAARNASLDEGAATAAWELTPLAAALGRMGLATTLLLETAQYARASKPVESVARGMHHLTSALVALHSGQIDRFELALRRAVGHSRSLGVNSRNQVAALCTMLPNWETNDVLRSRVLSFKRPLPQSMERSLYRSQLALRRHARRGWCANIQSPHVRPRHAKPDPGEYVRTCAEFILTMARQNPGSADGATLAGLESSMAMKGLPLVRARILAIRSRAPDGSSQDQAQRFSQAVALLETAKPAEARAYDDLPAELADATQALNEHLQLPMDLPPRMRELHAVAHKVLLQHGTTAAPDQRLASALRKVLQVSARMRGGGSLESLLNTITHDALDITGAQRACVVEMEEGQNFVLRASTQRSSSNDSITMSDLSTTVIQRAARNRKALFWHDVFEDPELMRAKSMKALSLRSALCAPLMRGDKLYGVMYADTTSAAAAFDEIDLEVLRLFADQAAAAIESSKLVEDVQRSLTELKDVQDRLVKGERLRVMGELSSGVAHEFNNLLTAILARIQMMGLNYLPAESKRDLDLIEKAALDAAEVVRRLQSFSRQQRQADFKTLDLGDICQDALELLRPLWRRRGGSNGGALEVELHAQDGLFVRGDATELREVLTNLVKNSIEAVGDVGHVHVVAARKRGRIQVRVEDSGQGIPPDVLSRVFDPFFTTKGERGTGLGLCLSQQIVEKHSGEITVQSELGQGTTIEFVLPAVERSSLRQATPKLPSPKASPALRVVLVDDDAEVLAPLTKYLEGCGFDVFTASNGAAGLELAASENPNVVLTDIGMPGMDGLEMCRLLHERKPKIPVVLMSGWASDVDRERARVSGATDVVSKPFPVLDQVRDLLVRVARDGKA